MTSASGPVDLTVESIETNSLINILKPSGLLILADGAKPAQAQGRGLSIEAKSVIINKSSFELTAETNDLDLADLTWLDPENLAGASGNLVGNIYLFQEGKKQPILKSELSVKEPGGNLQARFFQMLVPYLPKAQVKSALKKIESNQGLVEYKEAKSTFSLDNPQELKVFLHITVPVYNLVLNLNMTVKLDEENGFAKLAQLAGLVKIKVA